MSNKNEELARSVLFATRVSDLFATIAPFNSALDYHLDRHNVLSSNIAHVDTPGYKPKDLARVDDVAFQDVLGVTMERTNGAHLGGGVSAAATGRPFTDTTAGGGADGNYVSLDREASKLAANQLRYDIVSVVVSAELKGLLWAANNGTDA